MAEAAYKELKLYPDLNGLFTRRLAPQYRPQPIDSSIFSSPADGRLAQLGKIENSSLIQAKGIDYNLTNLMAGDLDLVSFTYTYVVTHAGSLSIIDGLVYIENIGPSTVPEFVPRPGSTNPFDGIEEFKWNDKSFMFYDWDRSIPALGDLDGDGTLRLCPSID